MESESVASSYPYTVRIDTYTNCSADLLTYSLTASDGHFHSCSSNSDACAINCDKHSCPFHSDTSNNSLLGPEG